MSPSRSRLSRVATKERLVSKPSCACPGDLWSDLFLGCRVVSTQPFAGAHVLAQPALFFLKLVEPGCDEGAARVETILCVPGGPVVACGNFGLRLAVKLV